mmetsp:Transcript_47915/g.126862  ORF Transcript_47915/g.126862 Transcript_47915/m.126862 type:complete len:538 (-) Transcript_47915:126-1739(-)|eukprot:CAMPEP_0194535276 /NCGR_PEP_ID=MMETSP0253-20130528/73751_1 /TAXON_ID=2966 /ORGANISM="Noctiluca scintillans" /LENGTH=537 /DNA_ID=CAMNT_0039381029 /DNA_START=73 /DNA_END=1686 /DNA_ORIENTATION=+
MRQEPKYSEVELTASAPGTSAVKRPQKLGPMILVGGISSLGGFLFGYDTGVVSGAMIELKSRSSGLAPRELTTIEEELIVSVTVAAAAFGSLFSGLVQQTDFFGRKSAIILGAFVFTLGAALMAIATNLTTIIWGRLIVGIGVGVAAQTVPTYISEMSPPHLRGVFGVVNASMIVFGQVIASAACCIFASHDLMVGRVDGWRWMLGLGGLPSALLLVGMLFLPESPRWLVHYARDEHRAFQAMMWLVQDDAFARQELASIRAAVEDDGPSKTTSFKRIQRPRVRRALTLGVVLMIVQQGVGINTVMYYSSSIVQMSQSNGVACGTSETQGVDVSRGRALGSSIGLFGSGRRAADGATEDTLDANDVSAVCWSAPIASSQLLGTFVGIGLVDRCGRRPLLLWSMVGICIFLFLLGASFHPTRSMGSLSLASMCAYLFTFGMGLSPIPWVMNAEIYSADVRGIASGISTSVNWVANFAVASTFLDLASLLSTNRDCPANHPDGAFWLYGTVGVAGMVWLAIFMPETKGKTLEEIDAVFE